MADSEMQTTTAELNEEEFYTDGEASEALNFIKEHQLPMSDLLYALKYVRILNGATGMGEPLMNRPGLSEITVAVVVKPPPYEYAHVN